MVIWMATWGYVSKKSLKISFAKKINWHFSQNEKNENKPDINVIVVRKLNDLKNDAELDGQWWDLMDKDRFEGQ